MTSEQIVRALAAANPPLAFPRGDATCMICGAVLIEDEEGTSEHGPACPWRMAVEWVTGEDPWQAAQNAYAHLLYEAPAPDEVPALRAAIEACPEFVAALKQARHGPRGSRPDPDG